MIFLYFIWLDYYVFNKIRKLNSVYFELYVIFILNNFIVNCLVVFILLFNKGVLIIIRVGIKKIDII